MSLESELVAYLESQSLSCADRIYPARLPETPTLPAVVFAQVSTPVIDIIHAGDTVYELDRYQFDCYAQKYVDAKALARVLIEALRLWPDYETYLENMLDLTEFEPDRYRITVEFFIGGAQ